MKHRRWSIILGLSMLTILIGTAVLCWQCGCCGALMRALTDRHALERLIDRVGPWGPLIILLAEIGQVLLAPIPGQIVGIVAGYLYGVFWGTVICSLGLAVGTMVAMALGRRLGRPLVEKLADPALLTRIDRHVQQRGPLAFFLAFLLPFLPDDLICFVAGLTSLRLSELVLLAVVGRLPGIVVSTIIGTQAQGLTWMQWLILGGGGLILALLFARHQTRLERWMFALIDRLLGKERGGRSTGGIAGDTNEPT